MTAQCDLHQWPRPLFYPDQIEKDIGLFETNYVVARRQKQVMALLDEVKVVFSRRQVVSHLKNALLLLFWYQLIRILLLHFIYPVFEFTTLLSLRLYMENCFELNGLPIVEARNQEYSLFSKNVFICSIIIAFEYFFELL